MDWTTVIVLSLGCAGICAALAVRKNREPVRWAVLGFLMGIFGIAITAIMPKVEKKEN